LHAHGFGPAGSVQAGGNMTGEAVGNAGARTSSSQQKETRMAARLFVGNLSYSTTSEGLSRHLGQCGEVTSAQVITDGNSGRSRGYAFAEMASEAEASAVISKLNGEPLDGRNLKIEMAKPRSTSSEGARRGPVRAGRSDTSSQRWRERRDRYGAERA
jgi:cold-inducible RNA-binding protein